MSRRTYSRNAYESGLASGAGAGGDITVDSAVGLTAPVYLVIDPDDPAKREYVKAVSIDLGGGVLGVSADRGLEGSAAGAQTHDAGAKVRSVAVHQWLNDIFDDVEDLEQADIDHVAAPDPHPQYQTEVEGDARYVEVGGDTMTGELLLPGTPSTDATATDRLYVDDADALAVATAQAYSDSLDHDHATPIAAHAADADAHHAKYTDAEAIAAARGDFGARPLVYAFGSGTDKNIPKSTWTIMDFFNNIQETSGDFDGTTFTAPEDGFYQFTADAEFSVGVIGQRSIRLVANGRDVGVRDTLASAGQDWVSASVGVYLSASQEVTAWVYQSDDVAVTVDNSACMFSAVKVSD